MKTNTLSLNRPAKKKRAAFVKKKYIKKPVDAHKPVREKNELIFLQVKI